MNKIYLMTMETKDCAFFKVGFSGNLIQRFLAYATHNPICRCISTNDTYAKSKRTVETAYHNEILAKGYDFAISSLNGKKTEWFKVAYDDPFYTELITKGLQAFKTGKNRKNGLAQT
jgi:hypothetical protein